jgi:hypothetical protein
MKNKTTKIVSSLLCITLLISSLKAGSQNLSVNNIPNKAEPQNIRPSFGKKDDKNVIASSHGPAKKSSGLYGALGAADSAAISKFKNLKGKLAELENSGISWYQTNGFYTFIQILVAIILMAGFFGYGFYKIY